MKSALALSLAVALAAPAAFAGENGVRAEFKFETSRSTEANYEQIQQKASSVCRDASRRSDTFAPTDTQEIVETCKSDLVDQAITALGITELSDMHAARS